MKQREKAAPKKKEPKPKKPKKILFVAFRDREEFGKKDIFFELQIEKGEKEKAISVANSLLEREYS